MKRVSVMKFLENKKNVIWDWNGTILNDVEYSLNIMNNLLSAEGLEAISYDKYRDLFEFPIKNFYDKLGFDYSSRSFEDLCHQFVDEFINHIHECRPFSKVEKIIINLQKDGFKQSVLSATDQDNLDEMINQYKYRKFFDATYGINNKLAASKIKRGKELLIFTGYNLDETIIIGDTLHDLEVGRILGIDVCLVSHGHQAEEALVRNHDWICNFN